MYLDDEPPIAGGREIWGFPKKHAHPKLEVIHDTLTRTLDYAETLVPVGSMNYKHENIIALDPNAIIKKMSKTQVNLKLIPDIDGSLAIAQLVAYNLVDIHIKGAWSGQTRLQLHAHVNADLPIKKVLAGLHFIADLTLPHGRVLFD
jgi:acetoacetate decarboxylase